jgi:hypothetical protein
MQVIGTPASGKSLAMCTLRPHLDKKVADLFEDMLSVDLDVARESITSHDAKTLFVFMVRALLLFERASRSISARYIRGTFDALVAFINGDFAIKFREILNKHVSYDRNTNSLLIDGKRITNENSGTFLAQLSKEGLDTRLQEVFDSFETFSFGNIINRYEHLTTVMEGLACKTNVHLDNAGSSAKEILECLHAFRINGHLVMTVLIQPRTVAVNILLSALRGIAGAHYAEPRLLIDKYGKIADVALQEYQLTAEHVIVLESDADLSKIRAATAAMNVTDNNLYKNMAKVTDLFIVDSRATLAKMLDKAVYNNPRLHSRAPDVLTLTRVSFALLLQNLDTDPNLDRYRNLTRVAVRDALQNGLISATPMDLRQIEADVTRLELLKQENPYINRIWEKYDTRAVLSGMSSRITKLLQN